VRISLLLAAIAKGGASRMIDAACEGQQPLVDTAAALSNVDFKKVEQT
jgi:hypothetical protein